MEVALKVVRSGTRRRQSHLVSILILMEVALKASITAVDKSAVLRVSILILMEVALKARLRMPKYFVMARFQS